MNLLLYFCRHFKMNQLFCRLLYLVLVSFCSKTNAFVSKSNAILTSQSFRSPWFFATTTSTTSDIESSTLTHNHISRKVFCNVELNGELIEAVGFDMDFTLAQVLHRLLSIFVILDSNCKLKLYRDR